MAMTSTAPSLNNKVRNGPTKAKENSEKKMAIRLKTRFRTMLPQYGLIYDKTLEKVLGCFCIVWILLVDHL